MKLPKSMREARLQATPDTILIVGLALFGLGLIIYRWFFAGIGGVTNLSDGYPWGFWIGIDILAGIALAAGGFVMAGLVHIFGGKKYHALIRPAILTAFLGYLLFIGSLMVDLGRPWNLYKAIYSWNQASPMFEVAWCVMMYTTVLFLEFVPAVLERLKWDRLMKLFHQVVPFVIIGMITLWTYAMSHSSLAWAGAIFAVLVAWEVFMRLGIMPRDKQMPLLLIMAGIMFSVMHQSSLGTLFLIVDKLSPLWYSPILPILFLISAVMVAPAMVSFEALATAWAFRRTPETRLLQGLGKAMPYIIGIYLLLRVGDVVVRGAVGGTLTFDFGAFWWWLEIGLLAFAWVLYTTPEVMERESGIFTASLAVIFSLVVHRVGVSMVGIDVPEYGAYVPAWTEVMITVGILSWGLIAFRLAIHFLPIYEEESHAEDVAAAEEPREAAVSTISAG